MTERIVVEEVRPRTPNGRPAKAVVGRPLRITADVYRDGHDHIAARVRWRASEGSKWQTTPMHPLGNDRWEGVVEPATLGAHEFVVEGWWDRIGTWHHHVVVKREAGQHLVVEFEEGARLLEEALPRVNGDIRTQVEEAVRTLRDTTMSPDDRLAGALDPHLSTLLSEIPDPVDMATSAPFPLWVDRDRALVGAWYELFPRSYGGLRGAADELPRVASMGFDVVYLPPVHPIGRSFRKGKNNTLVPGPDDPGSPWAIGAEEGGHCDLHPDLGTFEDFDAFVARTRALGMEVALDYALQCSPDHPWVAEHPEWFHQLPDGTIRYAENPPKKYQDIYPLNLWPSDAATRQAMWNACKEIIDHWISHGVRIFRVDNPHTKPFPFWEWLIGAVQAEHPDIVFLAEAFTRPKVMARLAEVGFSQSYTYFTWRNTKWEFVEYLTEIAYSHKADYMRPNFWPNTPDILSGVLRGGGPGAFKMRLVLAATMVPSYGMYSGYELFENEPASPHNEEYLNSEKYEIKHRNFNQPDTLAYFISRLNTIRRRHPALAELSNIHFHHSNNDNILVYSKTTSPPGAAHPLLPPDGDDDCVLVVVNLDPHHTHEDTLFIDLGAIGLPWDAPYEAHDELTGVTYLWHGPHPYVRLSPDEPAHVIHLRRLV